MSIIVDASVGIQWTIQEPTSARALTLLDSTIFVPDLFFAECANILWKKVTRKEITVVEARDCAQWLETLDLRVVSMTGLFRAALALACDLGHPAYDCIYLALARARDMPLVTADLVLLERCRKSKKHEWLKDLVRPLASGSH
ncbi:MAG TPA: type II toxin-antitoxin system VapC family toxin [Rudaea sp.]|nr:type II toxin-antitoxin system VapC family toxin [Rudaea sp.]